MSKILDIISHSKLWLFKKYIDTKFTQLRTYTCVKKKKTKLNFIEHFYGIFMQFRIKMYLMCTLIKKNPVKVFCSKLKYSIWNEKSQFIVNFEYL